MNGNIYLLVLGSPRAGTSLLAAMIGRHPDIAMLHEDLGRSIRHIVGKPVVGNKLCIPNHIEMRQKRPHWVRVLDPRMYRALYQRGYFAYRPEASLSLEDYLRWQPIKLIATVREGSAVIDSIMRRGHQSWDVAAYRWRRGIEILNELQRSQADNLLLLSFRHLVREPEPAMRAVAEHLGLAFDPVMLEGYAYTPNYSYEKIDASTAKRRGDPNQEEDLRRRFPEVYASYERLTALSALRSEVTL